MFEQIEMKLTRKEALALVRKSEQERATWALSVRLDASIEGSDKIFQDGLASYINLSRAQAAKLLSSLMSDTLEGRGARICIGRVRYAENDKPVYWISQ